MKKDKRPTKIYPDHREKPVVLPTTEPSGEDLILPKPPEPPVI